MVFQTNIFKHCDFSQAARLYQQAYQLQLETLEQMWQQRLEQKRQQIEQQWQLEHQEQSYEGNALEGISEQKPNFQDQAHKVGLKALEPWCKTNQQKLREALPLLQQWVTRRGTNALVEVEGQIDPRLTAKQIFQEFKSLDDRGLWLWTQVDSRSNWLQAQYKDPDRQWCALVPTILYSFKSLHSIPYSRWNRDGLHWLVNHNLATAMLSTPPKLSTEEILEIRLHGLRVKTGSKTGDMRKPETTYKLYGITNSDVRMLPELAQVMLTQIWCAHPQNRTKYMILDPENWDRMPEPLVNNEIFAPAPVDMPWNVSQDLPWHKEPAKQKTNVKMPQGELKLPWED
jgi:hypothetical protein